MKGHDWIKKIQKNEPICATCATFATFVFTKFEEESVNSYKLCIRTCKRIKKGSSHLKLSPFLPVKFPIGVTVFFNIRELPIRILEVNITL